MAKKNNELEKLYKRKWYYKNIKKDLERARTIQLMIDIEKRRIKMEDK